MLSNLARQMHLEGHYKHTSFSIEKIYGFFSTFIDNPSKLGLIFETETNLIGGFFASSHELLFSYEKAVIDLGFFITPEYRGQLPIYKVIKTYELWAKSVGACRINLSQSTGIKKDKLEKLYTRLGYDFIGSNFCKTLT